MEALVQKLRQVLEVRGDVAFAVLFGSGARGKLRPSSDVDVALRLESALDAWALGGLATDLEQAVGRRVDVVLLPEVRSPLLRYEIAKGVPVLGSREEWVQFQVRAMREWRDEEPRFRRLAEASLRKFLQEQAARSGGAA